MGIINGEFGFGAGKNGISFQFPIQSPFAMGELSGKPKLQKSDFLRYLDKYEIKMFLKEPRKTPDINQPGINIAIGDEEVKDFIRNYRDAIDKYRGEFPLILPVYKMCILLGRYLHNFPEQTALLKEKPDLFKKTYQEI